MIPGITASGGGSAGPASVSGVFHGGAVNETYSTQLSVSPSLPVTWSISAGALPSGWTIDSVTGEVGGVATGSGTFTFTARATGDDGYAEKEFSVVIGTVVTLLHLNGGDATSTFTDEVDGVSWTRSGSNATISTLVTAKFGSGSLRLQGSANISRSKAGHNYGSGAFSIDFWARPSSSSTNFARLLQQGPNSTNGGLWIIRNGTDNPMRLAVQTYASAYHNILTAASPQLTTVEWNHVYLGRDAAGTWYFAVNGTLLPTNAVADTVTQQAMYLGSNSTTGESYVGYQQEVRVTTGVARWKTNFTPPTAPSDFPVV